MNAVEHRRSSRYLSHQPIRLHASSKLIETLTKNISEGGLRCLSPQLFPVSTELGIELLLFKGEEALNIRGKAVWFRTIPYTEQFDLGISFLGLNAHDKRRLSAYLSRLGKDSSKDSLYNLVSNI